MTAARICTFDAGDQFGLTPTICRGEHALINRNRKFVDSPLEGSGFELPVPRGAASKNRCFFWAAAVRRIGGARRAGKIEECIDPGVMGQFAPREGRDATVLDAVGARQTHPDHPLPLGVPGGLRQGRLAMDRPPALEAFPVEIRMVVALMARREIGDQAPCGAIDRRSGLSIDRIAVIRSVTLIQCEEAAFGARRSQPAPARRRHPSQRGGVSI
jgi:hypothetical protein